MLHLTFHVGAASLIVSILDSDKALPTFLCVSDFTLPSRQVAPELYPFLLNRNSKITLMGWQVIERSRDGMASFAVKSEVFTDSLNAGLFKHLCTKMAEEVAAFDQLLRSEGLLR